MKGSITPPPPMPPAHMAPFVAGMRALKVFTNNRMIGYLAEFNDIWQFEYTQEWAEDPQGWSLSPGLPRAEKTIIDGSTNRPVQWYFDNLLPEEGMRTALAKTETAYRLLVKSTVMTVTAHPPVQLIRLFERDLAQAEPTDKRKALAKAICFSRYWRSHI